MAIIPDTKDWTWTISRPCPDCGFDPQGFTPHSVATAMSGHPARWLEALSRAGARQRPTPEQWSALEYGAHVRDVAALFRARLELMLSTDDARFSNWDQDATAVEQDYAHQEPASVAEQIREEFALTGQAFAQTRPQDWERTGLRSNGSAFTVATLASYMLHDLLHHLHDVDA